MPGLIGNGAALRPQHDQPGHYFIADYWQSAEPRLNAKVDEHPTFDPLLYARTQVWPMAAHLALPLVVWLNQVTPVPTRLPHSALPLALVKPVPHE